MGYRNEPIEWIAEIRDENSENIMATVSHTDRDAFLWNLARTLSDYVDRDVTVELSHVR